MASTPQTPSFTHLSSTSLPPSSLPPSLPRSGERELSVGEYFGRRSYKMGALEGSGALSSSERVSQIITTGTYSGEAKSPQQNLAPFTKLQNLTHELSLLKFHLAYPPTSSIMFCKFQSICNVPKLFLSVASVFLAVLHAKLAAHATQ